MRKFMIVIDDTPECTNALRFAARRAAKTGGGVVMLYVIRPEEFQHWIGVAEVMRAEAREVAEERLTNLAEEVKALSGVLPEFVIREGDPRDEVITYIKEDPEIGVLVLGASVSGDGPGPLVSALAGRMAGALPVPVTVVPGSMSLERIDAVC
ncbi:universal stress protein [Pikeienuella sp. HZG-20]|uniref:universal stress protein n=1 Tax=Paludibacillus litoralis TaxID=3133267 RepID=UPI0030EBD94C